MTNNVTRVGTCLMSSGNGKKYVVYNVSNKHEGDLRAGIEFRGEGSLMPGTSFTNLLEIYRDRFLFYF